jgi:hypothetical protein
MRITVRGVLSPVVIAFIALVLSACAVRLLPNYDEATYQSLSDLNAKALTLFSSLSAGGTTTDFPKYEAQYNELIGGFSADRMALAMRPTPPAGQRLFGGRPVSAICGKDVAPEDCLNTTPHNLDQIIALLTKMRDVHRKRGLPTEIVSGFNGQGGFRGQYQIEITRVLTIEAALQR